MTSLSQTFAALEAERSRTPQHPKMRDTLAVAMVTVTVTICAHAMVFGALGFAFLCVLWLGRAYYKKTFILYPSKDIVFGIVFSGLCCLSAFWSSYPTLSLYEGAKFGTTFLCAIVIARIVRTEALVRGMVIGTCIVAIVSLASGNYGVDPFSGNYSLVGLFGSKNQVGLFAEMGIVFALLSLMIPQKMVTKLLFSVGPLLLCSVTLYLSKSASSVLTLFFTLGVFASVYYVAKLPRKLRRTSFVLLLIIVAPLVIAAVALDVQDAILAGFGKDSTLTGRTVLWEEGIKAGMNAPILGHGYSAFWVPGQPLAEKLWYKFDIPGRMGFHFHNLYVEVFVGLGLVGLVLMVGMLVANCSKSVQCILRHGMHIDYAMALLLSFMFISRAFVELDVFSPFSISTMLCFSTLPRLALYHREQAAKIKRESHG